MEGDEIDFEVAIEHDDFKVLRATSDKLAYLLAVAYAERGEGFDAVLALGGEKRRYFGVAKTDIMNSGAGLRQKQIPGSPYWLMTKTSNHLKKKILCDVLGLLGYSKKAISVAVAALD